MKETSFESRGRFHRLQRKCTETNRTKAKGAACSMIRPSISPASSERRSSKREEMECRATTRETDNTTTDAPPHAPGGGVAGDSDIA